MSTSSDRTVRSPLALNRRTFVGLSAGATAAGATMAAALGAGEGFGAPHPPLVSETDPTIATAHPQIRYGTRTLGAYYAAPQGAGRSNPGVVVVQAIWGVDAQLRDVVRRLAKAGYIAIAPDLYTGLGAPNGDGATDYITFRAIAQKLADDQIDADLAAAADFIRAGAGGKPEKIGIMGFCMGGSIALRQTVDNSTAFTAASVFYGKVRYGTAGDANDNGAITPIALAYVDKIAVPLCGSWGALDTSISAADVRALEVRLTERKKPHDIYVYSEAGHAFFDDTRSSYVANAATDAWTRTLGWFAHYLT